MADDNITVNMYPSCGSCKNQSDYEGYKKYTKTWKNLCTSTTCNSKTPGTLTINPKGTFEGELTCSKCDSDYCGFCGTEKSGSARFKLIAADGSSDEDNNTEDSSSTYADMIKDLIKPWDGDVECRIEENKCYINKIKTPEKNAIISIIEGANITSDSVTIHDYNPDTPNILVVTWGESQAITIKDNKLIERFGEKKQVTPAVKKVTTYTTETSSDSSTDTDSTSGTNSSTDNSETSSDSSSDTETKTVSKVEEIPIDNYDDALDFAKNEWGKIRRKDGHSLETKIFGHIQIKQGQWVKVFIPSFDEASFMYLTKTDNSAASSDEWLTGVTLVDYPPSLSSGESNKLNDSDSDSNSDTTDSSGADTGTVSAAGDGQKTK